MPRSANWVIKLGGSMMTARELPEWLTGCAQPRSQGWCVVIVGGGQFADEVRRLQRQWTFADGLAHELAIRSMGLNARIVSQLKPTLKTFGDPASLAHPQPMRGGYLWVPEAVPTELALVEDWSVSSDSIALSLADYLGASNLLLVKSCVDAELNDSEVASLSRRNIVDQALPSGLQRSSVTATICTKREHALFAQAIGDDAQFGRPLNAKASQAISRP